MKGPVIVFSGHRIDEPDRAEERFPARLEPAVGTEFVEVLDGLEDAYGAIGLGLASLASGGDILFHETLQARGIDTVIYLPLPLAEFLEASVEPAGPSWVHRARELVGTTETVALPPACDHERSFEAANAHMVDDARALAGPDGALVMALWDGQPSDQPGGTSQMIGLAEQHDLPVVIVDLDRILHGSDSADGVDDR